MRVLSIALSLCLAAVASADVWRPLSIESGSSECPSHAEVKEALKHADPTVQVVEPEPGVPAAVVLDAGESFRVSTDKDRVITDPARNCGERARSAALVLVLWLDYLQANAAPPPALIPPPTLVPPPAVHSRGPRYLRLDSPLVARSLVLPRGAGEVTLETTVGMSNYVDQPAGALPVGFASVVRADFGIGGHTQLGFTIGSPIDDAGKFVGITVLGRAQVGLHRFVAMRFELGYDHVRYLDHDALYDADGFFASFSLPVRWRFGNKVALTALGGGAQRFEWIGAYGSGAFGLALPHSSQSLIAVRSNRFGTETSLFFPIGLLVQPHALVALYFQAGPRLSIADYDINENLSGISTSVDLIVSPNPFIDVGLSFETPITFGRAPGFLHGGVFARARF